MKHYSISNLPGVPDYNAWELADKRSAYCLLIPVINEGARILTELGRAQRAGIDRLCDIIICDGGSDDGSVKPETMELYGVNTLLVKTGPGKQGAQLRMGLYFALQRDYKGVLTIDGNNKDSIEDVPRFIEKLQQGYDLVQGSRFVQGGHAVNTPPVRYAAVRLIHAPVTSLAALSLLPREEVCRGLERLSALCEEASAECLAKANACKTLYPRLGACLGAAAAVLLL